MLFVFQVLEMHKDNMDREADDEQREMYFVRIVDLVRMSCSFSVYHPPCNDPCCVMPPFVSQKMILFSFNLIASPAYRPFFFLAANRKWSSQSPSLYLKFACKGKVVSGMLLDALPLIQGSMSRILVQCISLWLLN